jgi:phosphate transport system ATP-binding protein
MNTRSHIKVRDLNVSYGSNQALKNVSLDIPDRKITAIIGPSGCGKSTLLKCFNRLIDNVEGIKVSGQVLVDDEDIFSPSVDVTNIRKKMGLLSQRPYPLPMSIYDNVAYGPRIHGMDMKDLDAKVRRHLVDAGLWDEVKDRLDKPAGTLSIGQQQRLCLARGLAVEPEIILADEPTSALDPVSAQNIEKLFFKLKDRYTIILVTHILRQAKRMADNVIFMYLGELIESGPAEQVFNSPHHEKTKAYISGEIS